MKFSVLIPTFNRRDVLFRTLSAAFAQEFPANEFEVIVVVDGSTDGTVEMLESLQPRCRFRFISQPNRGLPFARNAALEAAEGELVLLLDDDIVCDTKLLQKHAEQHSTADNLVVFGPVPLHPDSPPGLVSEQWAVWSAHFIDRLERKQSHDPSSAFWLAASAPAVNRSISRKLLVALGCCDEEMKDCHEDWDLGIRLWKAGVRFHFQPDAIAYHLYVKSDQALVQREAPSFARGEVALSRKHSEYRPLSMLARMSSGSWRHRLFVAAALRLPFSLEPILRPLFLTLNLLRRTPRLNRAGASLLSYRSQLKIYPEAARVCGSRNALKAEFGIRLPVLAYHHVGTPKPGTYPDLSVSANRFESHMRWLYNKGYRTISPSDWLQWCRDGGRLPEKPVLLTFDDAFADIAKYAFPVLQRYGFQATVFVVTSQIGGTNAWDEARGSAIHPLMTGEQIRYWAAQGIEFGAHSRTHPDLATVPAAIAMEELVRSRDELESLLDRSVTVVAYPYGSCNEAVADAAREAFRLAFATREGLNDLTTDLFLLKRSCVGLHDTVADLECLLRWGFRPLRRLRSRLRFRLRLKQAASRMSLGRRRKIFLDCGTHLGQGLRHFLRRGIIDSSWEIHAFEANPACQLSRRLEPLKLKIIPHDCAVWISDGSVAFRQENHQLSDSGSPTDGASAADGWGSSVTAAGLKHPGYESEITVPCIDFSRFVKELPSPAKIVCKLNVEGSEFAILRRMLSDGTIDRISKLYVEFHHGMVRTETDESVNDLVRLIRSRGVIVDMSEIYEIPYSFD